MAEWNQNEESHLGGEQIEEDEGIISQEDCWSVIQSYFDENVEDPPQLTISPFISPLYKHKSPHSMNSYKTQSKNSSMSHLL
jgi:hypothetical protein